MGTSRHASINRRTSETQIDLELTLDASSVDEVEPRIDTGVGFLDHMLHHLARHGQLALNVQARGDTHIDDHHTVEDVGIVLGQALEQALADKRGIERYGSANIPMDEALARVALDLSGRPALVYHVQFHRFDNEPAVIEGQCSGRFDTQLIREFCQALANHARMNLHIEVPWGLNNHHIAEAIFKALARSLRQAVSIVNHEMPTTKGVL